MYPIIFQTKLFTLNTLWVFISIGIVVSVYTLIKLSLKNGLKVQFISDNSWRIAFWSLIGARVVNIIINPNTYFYEISFKAFFQLFRIWDKGLNLWGAAIAFTIYFYLLCKEKDQDFFKWLDVMVPSAIVLLSMSHIGAFFDGLNYGSPTSLPWGVNFENFQIKYTVPIHPTQIYAFIYSSALVAGLIGLKRVKRVIELKNKGFIGLIGIAAYNLLQSIEGLVRGDDVLEVFGVRYTMIITIAVTIGAGVILYLRYNTPEKKVKT